MAFTVFPELSFEFNIAFSLFMYSVMIFFISWCFISSPSITAKYLYPVSSVFEVISFWQLYSFSPCYFSTLDVDKCTFLYSKLLPDVT